LQRDDIIGRSQTIRSSLEQVARSSQSNASVLITGESGTGKELFARAVHNNSSRASQPFVVVDCASLTETLAESVLFGHTRGAFTGAEKARDGLIRMANQGTLFLDEVGELPLTIQSSFLRVLQEHRFRPLGGGQEISSDFRVVAATNRRLAEMVQQGRFRSDLLFRLKSLTIHLPPLRERHGDIAELTLHFIDKICRQHNTGVKGMSPEFIMALGEYAWPGNVRELVNTLESAVVSAMDFPTLYPIHLPAEIRSKVAQVLFDFPREAQADHSLSGVSFPPLRELITSVEKKYLSDLISHTGGNIREVCRISGISRANIYARLRKYGIMRQFSL
jgi:two-component system NtrC family response regulator